MPKKNRPSVLKRQREAQKAEKALRKRERRERIKAEEGSGSAGENQPAKLPDEPAADR